MKKLFTFLILLALAIPAWAGEKTITISRNDVAWESANTVYNVTKGGVELVMSGGMNNPNFLLMKQQTTMTIKSHNFNIKRIVFHCLDNTNVAEGDETFYNGPQTMDVQYSLTHAEYAGKYSTPYNGSTYDGLWTSKISSGTYTDGDGKKHTSYPNGLPAGYELMFENGPRPIRFASIDITVEQEVGDIYELVTSQNEVATNIPYMIVGRSTSTTTTGRALSINSTGQTSSDNILSTPVTLLDNGYRVKASDETQFVKLASTGNSSYPYYLKAGTNYIRAQSTLDQSEDYNHGFCLEKVGNVTSYTEYFYTKVTINESDISSSWDYTADIIYQKFNPHTNNYYYPIRHNNDKNQFRCLYKANSNPNTRQQIYLYKPAQQYKVFTEIQPDAAYGTVSLRDGVLVDNGINWSQKMETVQFLVTPANGYKVKSVTIQELNSSGNVIGLVNIATSSPSINGTLYTFEMPGNDVNIVVEFEEVTYHNVNMVVAPNILYGNIFLTEGYVVQNDQVKSYEGENIVFNVIANPKDPNNQNSALYDLYSVTVTYTQGGQEISYTYTDGNYNFTMPDADVTITATFVYENGAPLYLLGTANGGTWQPNGIRFNYDPVEGQYYLDVYFKGVGEFGDTENYDPNGYFSFAWKTSTSWDYNNQNLRGVPMQNNQIVDTSTGGFQLFYNPRNNANESNAFKIPAGIYRFYVKSYSEGNDWLYVTKSPLSLTLDPMGGETAATAPTMSDGTVVTLEGDIYNKIMEINPNEPATNFKYKVDGLNVTPETTPSTTPIMTTLSKQANEDETQIELRGYNYLGWIVAGDTAFYKVKETPLKWIEEEGTPGNKYIVADELIIVHILNRGASPDGDYPEQRLIWAKDQGNRSICPTTIKNGQIDYMRNVLEVQHGDWDQSNWVMLKFPDGTNLTDTYERDMCIKAGTLKGRYVDKVNYCIEVESMEIDGTKPYIPNYYSTPNFLDANLNLTDESTGAVSPVNQKSYFFMNPKVQEVADVIAAVWNGSYFVIPAKGNGNNAADLSGAFNVGWDYNLNYNVSNSLIEGHVYSFRGVLNKKPVSGSKVGPDSNSIAGKDVTPDAAKQVMPFELNDKTATAISDVMGNKTVSSVKYYNITGIESDKPFNGVNIVVTRYTDGSFSTTKVLR